MSPPAISPVFGSSATCPETYKNPFVRMACEYGPMGFGPRSVRITSLMAWSPCSNWLWPMKFLMRRAKITKHKKQHIAYDDLNCQKCWPGDLWRIGLQEILGGRLVTAATHVLETGSGMIARGLAVGRFVVGLRVGHTLTDALENLLLGHPGVFQAADFRAARPRLTL